MDGHVSKDRHNYNISKEQCLLDNYKLFNYFKILMGSLYHFTNIYLLVSEFFQSRSTPLTLSTQI